MQITYNICANDTEGAATWQVQQISASEWIPSDWAMHLYMAGVLLPLIAEWLGHSQMETTQIYAQASIEMKRQASEKLAGIDSSILKGDVAFKYADEEELSGNLNGLK